MECSIGQQPLAAILALGALPLPRVLLAAVHVAAVEGVPRRHDVERGYVVPARLLLLLPLLLLLLLPLTATATILLRLLLYYYLLLLLLRCFCCCISWGGGVFVHLQTNPRSLCMTFLCRLLLLNSP